MYFISCNRVAVWLTVFAAFIRPSLEAGFFFANYTWTLPVWTTLPSVTNTLKTTQAPTVAAPAPTTAESPPVATLNSTQFTAAAPSSATNLNMTSPAWPFALNTPSTAAAVLPSATFTPQGSAGTNASTTYALDNLPVTTTSTALSYNSSPAKGNATLTTPTATADPSLNSSSVSSSSFTTPTTAAAGIHALANGSTTAVPNTTASMDLNNTSFNTSESTLTVSNSTSPTQSAFDLNTPTNSSPTNLTTPSQSTSILTTPTRLASNQTTLGTSTSTQKLPNSSSPTQLTTQSAANVTTPSQSSINLTTPVTSPPNQTLPTSSSPTQSTLKPTILPTSKVTTTVQLTSNVTTPSQILSNLTTPTTKNSTTPSQTSSSNSNTHMQSTSTSGTTTILTSTTTPQPAPSTTTTDRPTSTTPSTKQEDGAGLDHFYYLTIPHVASDLAGHSNATLSVYLTLTTTESASVAANISVNYPVYENVRVIVPPGLGVTVGLSPTLVLDSTGPANRGVMLHSSGCLHVLLYCIVEDIQLGLIQSLASTYVYPHFTLSNDYVIVTPATQTATTSAFSRLYIVSTADNNQVSIRLSAYQTYPPMAFTINGIKVTNPDDVNVSMDQLDVFFLESEADLTGSRVTTRLPIAVFVGLKQTDGAVSFEQLTPVMEEAREIITWPPLTSMTSAYRISAGVAATSIQVNSSRYCLLPRAGDTCEPHTQEARQIVADRPVTGLHAIVNGGSEVECLAPLSTPGTWRSAYAWAVPHNMSRTSGLPLDVFLIVVVKDSSSDQLVLDGKPFVPETKTFVAPKLTYVFLTKRIEPGYHSLRHNLTDQFGAVVYGKIQSTAFCTTLGVDHLSQHRSVLGDFPLAGNKLYQDTATTPTASTPLASSGQSSVGATAAQTPRTSTSTTSFSEIPRYGGSSNFTLTSEQVDEVLGKIKGVLYLDGTRLSAYVRRLSSASDDRPSCRNMGWVGAALVVTVLLALMIGDVLHAGVWLMDGLRNRLCGRARVPSRSEWTRNAGGCP